MPTHGPAGTRPSPGGGRPGAIDVGSHARAREGLRDELVAPGVTLSIAIVIRSSVVEDATRRAARQAAEERVAEAARALLEARAAARATMRENRRPTSVALTEIDRVLLQEEARKRGLSKSRTITALLLEAAHDDEREPTQPKAGSETRG